MHTLPVIRVNKRKRRLTRSSGQTTSQLMKTTGTAMSLSKTKMPEIKCRKSPANWIVGDCCHGNGEAMNVAGNLMLPGQLVLPEITTPQRTSSISSVDRGSMRQYRRQSRKSDKLDAFIDAPCRMEEKKKNALNGKIKDFITKENPGRPPITLRYAPLKQAGDETVFLKPKVPSLPINTNSCPNLYLLADREKWSYNYKPGKCRYLRCPQSPVLQPDEIFATD